MDIQPYAVQQGIRLRKSRRLRSAFHVRGKTKARSSGKLGNSDTASQLGGKIRSGPWQVRGCGRAHSGGIPQPHVLPAGREIKVYLPIVGGCEAVEPDCPPASAGSQAF